MRPLSVCSITPNTGDQVVRYRRCDSREERLGDTGTDREREASYQGGRTVSGEAGEEGRGC